ncbi:MAG TPA: 2Fe-2S iron-sulfur cluster-binding protein, partial [Pseudomonadales bacterium]|nr:2Fe-2S iron-sulfur cluster-binding protein [Pseudomonadales bacterium]
MHSIRHRDLGTPAPQAPEPVISLEIDGHSVSVPQGTSVLRAAALAGVDVPKLCATDTLQACGSCRLCLVEIEGQKGLPASCTTLAAPGMKVRTTSPHIEEIRRGVLELYVSEQPADWASRPAHQGTRLLQMATRHGVLDSPYASAAPPALQAISRDDSNPYFRFDSSLCIVCSRCVSACNDIQGTFALTVEGRGLASRIVASQHESFLASECVSCGQCVESCPTGALSEKSRLAIGLPEHVVTTTCAYCGVGCSFDVELRGTDVVRMAPNRAGGANHGHACVKGRFAYGYASHPERITHPMIRATIDEPWQEV